MNHCFGALEWALGHLLCALGISHLDSTLVFNRLRTCQRAEQKHKAAKIEVLTFWAVRRENHQNTNSDSHLVLVQGSYLLQRAWHGEPLNKSRLIKAKVTGARSNPQVQFQR